MEEEKGQEKRPRRGAELHTKGERRLKDIKKLREERGLSQKALAEKSGLSPSLIGKLEKGQVQSPSLYTLIQLAEGLGVGIEYLLEDG